jgi:hypothetical protein
MKRKETTPSGSAKEYVVLKWSTTEDMPVKRCDTKDRVSCGDTSSDTSKSLGEEVHTPWLFWSVANLEEDEAQSSGVLIRGKYGAQSSSLFFK